MFWKFDCIIHWDIHSALRHWEKANEAYTAVYRISQKHGLSSHVEMAKASDGLNWTYVEGKKFSNKDLLLSLEIYNNCFGEETRHPARISSFLTLARYFECFRESSSANNFIKDAIEEAEELYGTNSEKTREVYLSAEKAFKGPHKIESDLLYPIMETSTEDMKGRELVNLYIQKCRAKVLYRDGHHRWSSCYDSILTEAEKVIESMCGAVSLEMLKINESIAEFYQKQKQKKEAMDYFGRCIELYKKIFGEDHIEIAKACLAISEILRAEKGYSQAIMYIEYALKIQIEFYGEDDSVVSETYSALINACVSNGEFAKALISKS